MKRKRYTNEEAFYRDNLILRRRRYRTREDERRAFYRFICKINWFTPMQIIPRGAGYTYPGWIMDADANWYYVRPPCEQYKNGYPLFNRTNQQSMLERSWRLQSDAAFERARRDHDDQCEALALGIRKVEYRYRKRRDFIAVRRYKNFHRAFGVNFRVSNLDMDDVPTCVLKLCVALGALRAEIRNQTQGKKTTK